MNYQKFIVVKTKSNISQGINGLFKKDLKNIIKYKNENIKIFINNIFYKKYFLNNKYYINEILFPFQVCNLMSLTMKMSITSKGGGLNGKLKSIKIIIGKILLSLYPNLKNILKNNILLTLDSRKVETKKTGKPKAHKSPTFVKR